MKPKGLTTSLKWSAVVLVLLVVHGGVVAIAEADSASTSTAIDSCSTVTEPGAYVLAANITNSTTHRCIEIRTDDVVLKGNGNTIDGGAFRGEPTQGITVTAGASNVTVTNVTTTGWAVGVSYNGSNGRISNVEAVSNFGTGVALAGSKSTVLSNVTAVENELTGIHLSKTVNITITQSTARENLEGIWCRETIDSRVTGTRVLDNGGTGFLLLASRNNTISNVTAVSNAVGISLINTTTSEVVESKTIQNNDGIRVAQSRRNVLANHVASQNSFTGVSFDNSANNTIYQSTVTGNEFVGLHVDNGSSNRFSDLLIANNNGTVDYLTIWLRGWFDGASGIVLEESDHNKFVNITARNNRNGTFYAVNGSVNTVENFTLESVGLSFRATNVAIAPVSTPPQTPSNYSSTGGYVEATSLGTESWLSLEIEYSQTAVSTANVSEHSLRLWRYNDSWAPARTSTTGESGVNTDQNYVYANLTEFGVFTPLAPIQVLPHTDFPSKPRPLTTENAPLFVARYEEVRFYNELLNQSTLTVLDLDTYCTPSGVERVDTGFLATVRCGWNAIEVSPQSYLVAVDGASYTVTYFVNDAVTKRTEKYWGTGTPTGNLTTFQGKDEFAGSSIKLVLVVVGLIGFAVVYLRRSLSA